MRKRRKLMVELRKAEEQELAELLRAGVQPARVIKRAQTLRLLAAGQSPPQVGLSVGLTAKGVRDIGWRYVEQGLSVALYDRPWPGAPPRIKAAEKQRIIAMVCTDPPEGRARWTVRLIAQEAVKRKLVSRIGRESAGFASEPRVEAVAGKECGASPNWTRNASKRWRTCWRSMRNHCQPKNRSSAWTRSR